MKTYQICSSRTAPPSPTSNAAVPVRPLALAAEPNSSSVIVSGVTKHPKFLWEFLAGFSAVGFAFGTVIRHVETNRFIRANAGAIKGGGVELVTIDQLDANCGWVLGTDSKRGDVPLVPIISLPTSGNTWFVLNIKGDESVEGSDVVTYPYYNEGNDTWSLELVDDGSIPVIGLTART